MQSISYQSFWELECIFIKIFVTTFNIEIQNPGKFSKGVKKLVVDGVVISGNKIPVQNKNSCKVVGVME